LRSLVRALLARKWRWTAVLPRVRVGLNYVVSYQRHLRESGDEPEVVTRVSEWRQSQLVVKGIEIYSEFVVSVLAANNVGTAPRESVERTIGHSGEEGMIRNILRHTTGEGDTWELSQRVRAPKTFLHQGILCS